MAFMVQIDGFDPNRLKNLWRGEVPWIFTWIGFLLCKKQNLLWNFLNSKYTIKGTYYLRIFSLDNLVFKVIFRSFGQVKVSTTTLRNFYSKSQKFQEYLQFLLCPKSEDTPWLLKDFVSIKQPLFKIIKKLFKIVRNPIFLKSTFIMHNGLMSNHHIIFVITFITNIARKFLLNVWIVIF